MPLSRDKGNVSPQVDEGNSRTQHSDMPTEYTPEMTFGERGETPPRHSVSRDFTPCHNAADHSQANRSV